MRHEAQPQSSRHENANVSKAWRMYDALEEKVEPLVADYHAAFEPASEQSRKLESLLECKSLAMELREHVTNEAMSVLPQRLDELIKRIETALDKKLH